MANIRLYFMCNDITFSFLREISGKNYLLMSHPFNSLLERATINTKNSKNLMSYSMLKINKKINEA